MFKNLSAKNIDTLILTLVDKHSNKTVEWPVVKVTVTGMSADTPLEFFAALPHNKTSLNPISLKDGVYYIECMSIAVFDAGLVNPVETLSELISNPDWHSANIVAIETVKDLDEMNAHIEARIAAIKAKKLTS